MWNRFSRKSRTALIIWRIRETICVSIESSKKRPRTGSSFTGRLLSSFVNISTWILTSNRVTEWGNRTNHVILLLNSHNSRAAKPFCTFCLLGQKIVWTNIRRTKMDELRKANYWTLLIRELWDNERQCGLLSRGIMESQATLPSPSPLLSSPHAVQSSFCPAVLHTSCLFPPECSSKYESSYGQSHPNKIPILQLLILVLPEFPQPAPKHQSAKRCCHV